MTEPAATAPFGRRLVEVRERADTGAYGLLSLSDPTGILPRPGQFYMLARGEQWAGDGGRPFLPRAISVAEVVPAGSKALLRFLLHDVGPGTNRLLDCVPGEGVWLTGPLGNGFSPPAELAPGAAGAILVGGGIGIAPMALWRRALVEAGVPTRVLLGFRDGKHQGGVEALFPCCEVGLASESGELGATTGRIHRGYVTDLLARLLDGDDASGAAVYACGPPVMLDAVRRLCAEREVACELALEAPMACGFGACFGCALPLADGSYARLCVDGPVMRAEHLAPGPEGCGVALADSGRQSS